MMSARYLHLSCSVEGCDTTEMVYIGSLDCDRFSNNINGEQLSIECDDHECDDHESDAKAEVPGFEGTRSMLDSLTIRGFSADDVNNQPGNGQDGSYDGTEGSDDGYFDEHHEERVYSPEEIAMGDAYVASLAEEKKLVSGQWPPTNDEPDAA